MKIEKYVCDRCGREIFISSNKPSITLHKGDTELDLCGICITSFFNWYYKEENAGRELAALPSVTANQTKWIPVTERLPEEDGMYLISTCMNCIDTCLFYKDDDEYVWVDYEDSVRAWMPLPEPYKAESEEE